MKKLTATSLWLCCFSSHLVGLLSLSFPAFPERVHERCVYKTLASNISLNCDKPDEKIAILEASLTSSSRLRCPFQVTSTVDPASLTDEEMAELTYPRPPTPCTDDLRLSLNARCSGRNSCSFNLSKDHASKCFEPDGTVIIRYTCMSTAKYYPYCNLDLTGNYGYVSTPGYPEFYPMFGPDDSKCSWKIEGEEGQRIQIDVLDASIKEPKVRTQIVKDADRSKKIKSYICTDRLMIVDGKNKMFTLCGEDIQNLIKFQTKGNRLDVNFMSQDFSPNRGILFRYSVQNCASIPPPPNTFLLRNGSFAYYTCSEGHAFEGTEQSTVVIFCEYGFQWNSTVVPSCIPKEVSNDLSAHPTSSSVILDSFQNDKISDILIPIVLMVVLLIGNAVIVWVLLKMKRRHKQQESTESGLPLNSGPPTQV